MSSRVFLYSNTVDLLSIENLKNQKFEKSKIWKIEIVDNWRIKQPSTFYLLRIWLRSIKSNIILQIFHQLTFYFTFLKKMW
jgi:hypothetical protein